MSRRAPALLAPFVIGIAAALAAWLRLPDTARGTIWAEDGREFLQQALDGHGMLLLEPYAGYLQFVPRVVAWLTVLLVPPAGYALAMSAAACLITGLLAGVVFACARGLVPSVPLRLLLAAITVLVPTLPHEVLGDQADIHWLFLWVTPWLLLARPRSTASAIGLGALALTAALTEIQVAVFLPLMLAGWRGEPHGGGSGGRSDPRHLWWVRAGLLAGVAAQLIATALSPRGTGGATLEPARFALGYLEQVVLPLYDARVPDLTALAASVGATVAVGLCGLLPFAALGAVAIVRGDRLQRIAAVALLAGSVVLWTVAVTLNGLPGALSLQRYGLVPSMMLLGSAVVGIQVLAQAPRPRGIRAFAAVGPARVPVVLVSVLLISVVLVVQFVPDATRRSAGPVWADGVARAAGLCVADPSVAKVTIATGPLSPDAAAVPQWNVTLHCDALR
jgi:hypothetical protein